MKIKWLGHASFLITSDTGTKIITDPYAPSDRLKYGEIKESADIVTVSHEHGDHNNVAAVKGNPKTVRGAGTTEVKSIQFKGIPTYHDNAGGKERGNNTIFCFEVDGMRVCHLGDLGHPLNDKQVAEIGKVDVLLTPVGGYYPIDAAGATKASGRIKPRVVVPMHFKTSKCTYPIDDIEQFLKGKKNVRRISGSEADFKAGQLPVDSEILVLQPAL